MEPNFHSLEGYEYKKLEKERNNLRRGDVVVYKEKDNLKVRRVVGLPGEEIEIINSQVVIDDQNLSENYIQEDTTRRGNREKMSIPVGSYALMLDNRASSPADIVIVSVENIIGTITK